MLKKAWPSLVFLHPLPLLKMKEWYMDADELRWAKINVKTSILKKILVTFYFLWWHFMWIVESCAYWIIWILKNLKWVKKSSNIKVWFEQTMFNSFVQYFHKRPLTLHNTIFLIFDFFSIVIGYYWTHLKKFQIFIFFQFEFIKIWGF
jgi:hypothetical protein